MSNDTLTREVAIPAQPKRKLRAQVTAERSTLSAAIAQIVADYAAGDYDGNEGRINIATVTDPGFSDTDGRVKFQIPESVWEQAKVRAVLDETSIVSVVRRAVVALTADDR
jgi:hypothetical protein